MLKYCHRKLRILSLLLRAYLMSFRLSASFDGASTHTDHFTSGKKCRQLVKNAVFIRNKSLFFVSAVAISAFQLEHMPRLLRSVRPRGYRIRTIEYGKILAMLVYGEYYGRVYEVYNNNHYLTDIATFVRESPQKHHVLCSDPLTDVLRVVSYKV